MSASQTRAFAGRAAPAAVVLLAAVAQGQARPGSPAVADRPLHFGLDAPPRPPASEWRVELIGWVWLMGLEGDVGVADRTASVSADFGDILEASDSILAIAGRLEVGRGRWTAFVDGFYAKIGADDQSGPRGQGEVDVTTDMGLIDFGLMFRVGEWTPRGRAAGNPRDTALDVYAGGRYTYLDLELDPARLGSRSRSKDWIDPIVGARLVLPLSEKWHVAANGDVGGFGVGSDLTWSAAAVVGYDFTLFKSPSTLYLGYRALGQDFSEDQFEWDVVLHGPVFGLGFKF